MKPENKFNVNYNYDFINDILLFEVKHDFDYKETIEMDDGILLDFDNCNIPVSIYILSASKKLNVPKESLRNLVYFNMNIVITSKIISINANICLDTRNNINNQNIKHITSNNYNIPAMETELVVV